MNVYGGEDVEIHVFSTSVSGQLCPRFPLDKGWVGPRTGLDNMEERKFLPLP
jgi:hypothetical protein